MNVPREDLPEKRAPVRLAVDQDGMEARDGHEGDAPLAALTPRAVGFAAALRVLRRREFAFFWTGQTISMVGTWMQHFAQNWVLVGLTTSASALGLLNFAMSLPTLVLTPFGGVAADRFERRRILILAQWALLILAALTGVLLARDDLELWHLYGIALLLGVAAAFEMPAYQAFVPELVERDEIPPAVSLNQATFHGSRIIGPALASWVVARWGTAAAFFANSASFLAVIGALMMIRPRPPAAAGERISTLAMLRQGLGYVRERPELYSLLGITGFSTLFVFPNLAVLTPYYVKHVLHLGPGALCAIMSASGLGALLGAALLLSLREEQRIGRLFACIATMLATMTAMAWARNLWVAVVAITIQSFAIAQSLGLVSIMLQERVPNELRGRVMSLSTMMFSGVMPFAALLMPPLVDWIGMRWELQLAGTLYALATLLLVLRLRRLCLQERAA